MADLRILPFQKMIDFVIMTAPGGPKDFGGLRRSAHQVVAEWGVWLKIG
jgi:hypothetical protein